jgi:5'-3' exonuclease
MGVHDINKTIKEKISEPFISLARQQGYDMREFVFHKNYPLDNLRGYKIAFDAANILYAKMTTAHNTMVEHLVTMAEYDREILVKQSMKGVLGFFALIFKAGITPVVVFDGKLHPYKEAEIKKRSDIKKAKQDKVDFATQIYMNKNPLDISQEDENAYRKELRNNIKILKTDYALMRSMLEEIGIFCVEAEYDGEQLCSRLCREGIVNGVFSTDTDNYAHGCPFVITDIYHGGQNQTVCDYVSMSEMITALSQYMNRVVTQEEFIDLCILHGCDYNERTVLPVKKFNPYEPKYKACGGVGALDFITAYQRFECAPQHYWPCFDILNVHRCREIFYYQETQIKRDNIDTNLDWNKFVTNRDRVFQTYGFDGYLYRYFTSAFRDSFKIKDSNFGHMSMGNIQNLASTYIEPSITSADLLPHILGQQSSCLADSF